METVNQFIDAWLDDSLGTKPIFHDLFNNLLEKEKIKIEFFARPGISYSLRGIHENQNDRPLFVMIDVIDDDSTARWLSVCFYGDMIEDPDELGDLIPEGLLGSDGYCFDIIQPDELLAEYVAKRIQEAYASVCKG
jgi:hypothetical protein